MIAVSPDWFWSLMESIIDDGYYPTDIIIVLETKKGLIVKEGNRRIASLKIIHGFINGIEVQEDIKKKFLELDNEWKKRNINIPCAIYQETEIETVKKLVSLIHAKGEKAGREKWTAVARTRYDRDEKNKKEAGLDLLEKYLINGKNLTTNQKECWGGDYPITVLDELLPKLCPHLGYKSSDELLEGYPAKKRIIIDKILYDIGIKTLGFYEMRNGPFWGLKYGLSENKASGNSTSSNSSTAGSASSTRPSNNAGNGDKGQSKGKKRAYSMTDAKSVYKKIKDFKPVGNNREKVVSLLDEIKRLKIDAHPFSFCFLLRSMFEISAKAYCKDHKGAGLSAIKTDGNDKDLSSLLREIVDFMTPDKKNKDKEKVKILHGAITELNKKDGVLSVTSFNQLIHNPKFSIQPTDICILFHNIFPLLEEMNN
jgi:hypothetical protein